MSADMSLYCSAHDEWLIMKLCMYVGYHDANKQFNVIVSEIVGSVTASPPPAVAMGKRSLSVSSTPEEEDEERRRRRIQEVRDQAAKRGRDAARKQAAIQHETPAERVDRLERKAACRRAAEQRETPAERVDRLERKAACRRAAEQRETPAVKVARCECHAATTRAARTATQVSLDARLQEIKEGILERSVVDLDTLRLIASNQHSSTSTAALITPKRLSATTIAFAVTQGLLSVSVYCVRSTWR